LDALLRGAKAGLDVAVEVVVPEAATVADGIEEEDTDVLPPTDVDVMTCCSLGSRASEAADSLELVLISPFKAEGEEAADVIVCEPS
jgi:hypothetical protein